MNHDCCCCFDCSGCRLLPEGTLLLSEHRNIVPVGYLDDTQAGLPIIFGLGLFDLEDIPRDKRPATQLHKVERVVLSEFSVRILTLSMGTICSSSGNIQYLDSIY